MPMTIGPEGETNPGRWSLFARTLEDILGSAQHGETPLSRLDNLRERPGQELDPEDPRSPRELVHREKIGRLIHSLHVPGTFPLLSRDDLERIYRYFNLDHEEGLQLQAAVIATQVQRLVYGRFGAKDELGKVKAAAAALHAAEMLLPTLMEAARQMALVEVEGIAVDGWESAEAVGIENTAVAVVKADAFDALNSPEPVGVETPASVDEQAFDGAQGSLALRRKRRRIEKNVEIVPEYKIRRDRYDERPSISAALAEALDAVDRGVLALHLSYSASGLAEQLEQARSARDAFADALNQLDGQDAVVKSSEAWKFWEAEARSREQDADSRCSWA